jgi:hypothetical protein
MPAIDLERNIDYAIMAVDPGTTTGVARGSFVPARSLEEACDLALWESWEVGPAYPPDKAGGIMDGDDYAYTHGEVATEIMEEYLSWRVGLVLTYNLHPDRVILVVESFLMRPNKARGAGSDPRMLDAVRVASGLEARCFLPSGERQAEFEYQTPSSAKRKVSNERLKRWGMWVKGSDHRRDAVRHMVLRADREIS